MLAQLAGAVVGVMGPASASADGAWSVGDALRLLVSCERILPFGPCGMGLRFDVDVLVAFSVVPVLLYLVE